MGGRSVKKKPKQSKYVTMEMFQEFFGLTTDFITAVDKSLDVVENDINKMKAQAINDLSITTAHVAGINKRLDAVEQFIPTPTLLHTGQVSEEMLRNLKASKPNPVTVSTPLICNHYACASFTACKYDPLKNTPESGTAEERCQRILIAVSEALRLMRNIEYINSQSSFTVKVKCQGIWRYINVHFSGAKHCSITYYRRDGKHVVKEFNDITSIAAETTAVVMYYATR